MGLNEREITMTARARGEKHPELHSSRMADPVSSSNNSTKLSQGHVFDIQIFMCLKQWGNVDTWVGWSLWIFGFVATLPILSSPKGSYYKISLPLKLPLDAHHSLRLLRHKTVRHRWLCLFSSFYDWYCPELLERSVFKGRGNGYCYFYILC